MQMSASFSSSARMNSRTRVPLSSKRNSGTPFRKRYPRNFGIGSLVRSPIRSGCRSDSTKNISPRIFAGCPPRPCQTGFALRNAPAQAERSAHASASKQKDSNPGKPTAMDLGDDSSKHDRLIRHLKQVAQTVATQTLRCRHRHVG